MTINFYDTFTSREDDNATSWGVADSGHPYGVINPDSDDSVNVTSGAGLIVIDTDDEIKGVFVAATGFDGYDTLEDFVVRGHWDVATDYDENDIVEHSGSWWLAVADPAVADEPGVSANWDELTPTTVDEADTTTTVRFSISSLPTDQALVVDVLSRYTDSDSHNRLSVIINPDGRLDAAIGDGAGNTYRTVTNVAQFEDGDISNHVCASFRVIGQLFEGTVWLGDISDKPNDPSVSSGTASTESSGTIGVAAKVVSGGSGLPITITFYELLTVSEVPQEVIQDSFNRTTSTGVLGTSDSGHNYDTPGTAGGQWHVDGEKAVFASVNSVSSSNNALFDSSIQMRDFEAVCRVSLDASPTEHRNIGLIKYKDSDNYVRFFVQFRTTGTIYFITNYRYEGGSQVSETEPDVLSFTTTDPEWVWLKVQVLGSIFRIKLWMDGDPEPNGWTFEYDNIPFIDEGGVGLYAIGGVDEGINLYLDDLEWRSATPRVEVVDNNSADSPGIRITLYNADVFYRVRVDRVHTENKYNPTTVRGLDIVDIPSAVNSATDYEMQLNESFVYRLTTFDDQMNILSQTLSAPIAVEVPYHRVILRSVGQPALSRRIQITEFPSFEMSTRVLQEAQILNRRKKVILFDVVEGMTGSFSFISAIDAADPAAYDIRNLIIQGQPLMFQSDINVTGIPDFYFIATSVSLERKGAIREGVAPQYVLSLQFTEVDRPLTTQESAGFYSWQTLLDVGHTDWQSVLDTFNDWLAVLNFTARPPAE